jgi:VWFA-related protein
MGKYRNSVCAGVTLLLSGTVGWAFATQTTQKRDTPVFGVGVTLVAVPVFVIDKAGKSVPGLKAEDFEVEDGGKRVPIVSFQAVDVNVVPTVTSQSRRAELPLAVQAEAPRQFLILLDKTGVKGREAAATFVRDSLAPGDLVAAAKYDRSGLRVLTNFTTDHANVARAIEGTPLVGVVETDLLGLSGGLGPGGLIGSAAGPVGGGGSAVTGSGGLADEAAAAVDELQRQAEERAYRSEVTGFLQDLSKLVEMLGSLRGRKQILLLSNGFAEWAWSYAPSKASDSPESEPIRGRMESLFRAAGQSDVVIHTISLAGIVEGDRGRQRPTGSLDSMMSVRRVFNENSGRGTLASFAANTGGRFILPRNDFGKALDEVDQVSRHSYVIAFETADASEKANKPRKLKIRTRRPGLSVSHRPSYLVAAPKSGDAARSVGIQIREALSKGLSGGPLRLHLTTLPYQDPEGRASVQAVLQIEGSDLAAAATGTALAVQVYGYLMSGGRVLDSLALNTSLDLSTLGNAVRTSGIRLLTAFPASPGDQELRFFVRTGAAGITGTIRSDITVPVFKSDTVISAPMFTTSPSGKIVVPFQSETRPKIKVPFYVDDEAFVPDAPATLIPGRPREVCVFVWRGRSASNAPMSVTAEMAREGESALPVRVEDPPRVVSDPDGFDRYLITVVASDAPVGEYAFRLTFVEPGTGSAVTTQSAIVLAK